MFRKKNSTATPKEVSLLKVQPHQIMEVYSGFAGTHALLVAIELGIFQHIHHQMNTVDKLSQSLGVAIRPLRILLDALVALQMLSKYKQQYQLTAETKHYLVKGESFYLGDVLLRYAQSFENWNPLLQAVRKGPLLPENKEQATLMWRESSRDIFSNSYASAVFTAKKIGVGKSLKEISVLDVGAGSAAWSLAFAMADSSCYVEALDFPEVLPLTQEFVKKFRLEKQYDYLSGDVFELPLKKSFYDVVIVGHLCHHIGEAESKRLLKRCYEVLKPKGRLLLGEFVANDLRTGEKESLLFGLKMLLHTKQGDVFTVKEFKKWLSAAGFKKVSALKAVHPTTVISAIK